LGYLRIAEVGDTVLLSGDWAGTTVKVNEEELLMVREDEIIGLVELEEGAEAKVKS